MARLTLFFPEKEKRASVYIEGHVPTRGHSYTLENEPGSTTGRTYIVTLVCQKLWPKKTYFPDAKDNEYITGDHFEVMLASAEDIRTGRVRL